MLAARFSPRASVEQAAGNYRLYIPEGAAGSYRLAQLDDYARLPRRKFPHGAPNELSLRARASAGELPGTWGFGLWNDPFAFSTGLQGTAQRLPALPNACWFFHASAENHLAFHDTLAGSGFLAQSFRSPLLPAPLLAAGALGLPLLFSTAISRWLRKSAGKIIHEESRALHIDVTEWHSYMLSWRADGVRFAVDGEQVLETAVSPRGRLGVVIWIDNQYAAWRPNGEVGMGTLAQSQPGWLEIEQIALKGEQQGSAQDYTQGE